MENLLVSHSTESYEVIFQWECNYLEQRKDPKIELFLITEFKNHPLYRLQSRSCCRGGYVNVLALKWTKKLFPNEKLCYIDKNGLYSFVAQKFPFMTGKYEIIMGNDLKNIQIINNLFYYKMKRIMGSSLLTIILPKNLKLPFLMYRRKKDKKKRIILCVVCVVKLKLLSVNTQMIREQLLLPI